MSDKEDRFGVSRRDFLKSAGVGGLATAVTSAGATDVEAQAGPRVIGPGDVPVSLTVNGKRLELRIEPRVTLLDALRNYLDVTGCKRVCDRGSCGACTVLLEGKPVYSCSMLALEARGKKIRTAESLISEDGRLDAVPASFVKHDAQQCGFCTPGFVVALRAALDKNPKATPADVEVGLSGNICRCGTYEQMRHAIASLCGQGKEGG